MFFWETIPVFDLNFKNKSLIKVIYREDHPTFELVKTIKQNLEKEKICIFLYKKSKCCLIVFTNPNGGWSSL